MSRTQQLHEALRDAVKALELRLMAEDKAWRKTRPPYDHPVAALDRAREALIDSEEGLCAEIQAWEKEQGFDTPMCAFERLHEEITSVQRRWLTYFCIRWDEVMKRQDQIGLLPTLTPDQRSAAVAYRGKDT